VLPSTPLIFLHHRHEAGGIDRASLAAALLLFFSILNEKQRRLYAGLESLKLGHGGDAHIATLLGIDPHTVARGRQELEAGELDGQTMRAKGGGRLSQEKKRLT
jgi:hypothetical protein